MRVRCQIEEKKGEICLDQIRSIDKTGILRRITVLPEKIVQELKEILKEYLID